MPRDPIETLLDNLRETHDVYRRLLTVAEKKKTHILQNDIEGIRADIQAEETLSRKGAGLNAACDDLRRECSRSMGDGDDVPTLETLGSLLPTERREPFEEERRALKGTLRELRDRNRTNMVLVNNSLGLMEGLLAAMFGTETVSTYGRRGNRTRGGMPVRALNAKA